MSFSSNPLGQGARLDHNSFMNKNQSRADSPPEDTLSTSPPRRGVIPLSYAYGAPTLGKGSPTQTSPNRVPSPTRSSSSSVRNRSARSAVNNTLEHEEDIDSNISVASSSARVQEPGVVRYARLKQRNQALGATSYHPSGPGIILSPPNGSTLSNTSVNVATAFSQAARDAMPSTSGNYADYEKDTHSPSANTSNTSGNRRIAAPPPKSRKPNSKASTRLKPPDEVAEKNGRAKSPVLDAMASMGQAITRAAISPTRYFLRENDTSEAEVYQPLRMDDPPAKPPSRQNTKASTVPSNQSYDYEAEENYMRGEGSALDAGRRGGHQKKKSATMTAAGRLSLDNKAYHPPSDDDEEEDFEENGVRRKRKGKKKDEGKGLTSLPTIGYDKKKKRRSISKKSGVSMDEDEGVSEEEQVPPLAETRRSGSRQLSRPPSRTGSISHDSVPPSHPAHFQPPLDEVLETEEDISFQEDDQSHKERPPAAPIQSDEEVHRMESQTLEQHRFSVGGFLGRIVHFFGSILASILRGAIRIVAMIFFLVWTVLRGIYTVLIATPLYWLGVSTRAVWRDLPWAGLGKVVLFLLTVVVAGVALRPSSMPGLKFGDMLLPWIPGRGLLPSYQAPYIPPESVQDLVTRLTQIENTLSDLTFKEQHAQKARGAEQRAHNEVATRVELLHGRIESEAQRALEAEEQFRAAAAKSIAGIRSEFETLQSAWERAPGEGAGGSDVTADLRELQERVGTVEGGVKEALELGKASVKAGGNVGWWNKWGGSGEGKLTIKSSDGQDVTTLIGSIVDHAVSRIYKDGLGKPDFALYSAGGRVIPHLTSNTYEVKPNTWARYMIGAVTGSGYAMGRPPVTAIHPDINVGNCWPFSGSQGQIGLLLARSVHISEFSIDHSPRDIAFDVRAAPRQMEVWGLVQGADNVAKVREYQQTVRQRREEVVRRAAAEGVKPPSEEEPYPASLPRSPHYVRLAQFTYDVHSPDHVQTFSVPKDIQDIGADFGVVVLLIKNNWGEEDFTCLYRLRVHGTDKDRRPYLLPEQDSP